MDWLSMSDLDNADSWLSRAASSLERARQGKFNIVIRWDNSRHPNELFKENSYYEKNLFKTSSGNFKPVTFAFWTSSQKYL